ncbi:MAG TPA: arginine deiminase-related protein [Candidatus Binataceae bacterium]
MSRTILMGDPRFFSVRGGANPHTRNALGIKKTVDATRAREQWHAMAKALITYGVEVLVIPPHENLSGLVYPANAGFLYPLENSTADRKAFYLANLLPTRAGERDVYRPFLQSLGFLTSEIRARFEGEADFFPAGNFMIFTHGRIERQRFKPAFALPPWKRVYGFRSDARALDELTKLAAGRTILPLELRLEAHYHGDTVLCSFGAKREFLLAYMDGMTEESQRRVRKSFGEALIELSHADAALYAANSFQVEHEGRLNQFMPLGASADLCGKLRERRVEPVLIDVSEFLAKGGGSIKCMILDVGPTSELPMGSKVDQFRAQHSYQQIFPENR